MEENTTMWDDRKDEIMDIVEEVEDNQEAKLPLKCPLCDTNNAHIYMHRWENGRGTVWAWCSNCKSCTHASRLKLPDWWENGDFIDVSELTSHPIFLEPKVDLIDRHLNQLLRKEHLISNNKLKESNQRITYSGESIAMIIKELSYIVCSLDAMGSYYADKPDQMKIEYEKEVMQFTDNSWIWNRLAEIRGVLSEPFDLELGDDEMDDLERVCEDIPYWSKPGDFSTERWVKYLNQADEIG